jgi:hypothetical protein
VGDGTVVASSAYAATAVSSTRGTPVLISVSVFHHKQRRLPFLLPTTSNLLVENLSFSDCGAQKTARSKRRKTVFVFFLFFLFRFGKFHGFRWKPNPGVPANHSAVLTPRSKRQGVDRADDRTGAEMAGLAGLAHVLWVRRKGRGQIIS